MSRASGVPLEELRPYLFLLRDRDATSHLLRVSGGLDSLVMGEGQILAQVKQVHKVGQNSPGFGRQLNGLFKQAVTAGKRVRSETSISSGAVSVSSAAAELAQLKLPTHDFNDAKVGAQGGHASEGSGGNAARCIGGAHWATTTWNWLILAAGLHVFRRQGSCSGQGSGSDQDAAGKAAHRSRQLPPLLLLPPLLVCKPCHRLLLSLPAASSTV